MEKESPHDVGDCDVSIHGDATWKSTKGLQVSVKGREPRDFALNNRHAIIFGFSEKYRSRALAGQCNPVVLWSAIETDLKVVRA